MKKDRIDYFDFLKILSAFLVIVLHVTANNIVKADLLSFDWKILNFYNSLSRWTVPCFIMMSGAVFLRKDLKIVDLLKKYVLKLLIVYIVWSLIYTIIIYNPSNLTELINHVITGFYHMWYIPMLMGLYMLTPILKKIVLDSNILKYFLIIVIIFSIIIPTIINIIQISNNTFLISFCNSFKELIGNMNYKFGYISYYLLGYYLYKNEISRRNRRVIYILGIIGFILTMYLTVLSSSKLGNFSDVFYNNFSINVFFMAVAMFIFAKYNFKSNYSLNKISTYSLGIYLIHVLIIEKFGLIFHFNVRSFYMILSVPIVALIVFTISVILTFIIKKIPIFKKYII